MGIFACNKASMLAKLPPDKIRLIRKKLTFSYGAAIPCVAILYWLCDLSWKFSTTIPMIAPLRLVLQRTCISKSCLNLNMLKEFKQRLRKWERRRIFGEKMKMKYLSNWSGSKITRKVLPLRSYYSKPDMD